MKKEVYEKIKDDLPENLRKDVEKYGLGSWFFNYDDRSHDILRADYCVLQACIIESE